MLKIISSIRQKEITWYIKKSFLRIFSFTIITGFQGVLFLLAYWIQIKLQGTLQMAEVFCGVSVLISSHFYVTAGVSESIMMTKTFMHTFMKITEVLLTEEPEKVVVNESSQIKLDGVFASWSNAKNIQEVSSEEGLFSDNNSMLLKDFNVFIGKGQLCAVLGSVGCGKSTFLNTILGECKLIEGKVSVCGTIGYLSQEP